MLENDPADYAAFIAALPPEYETDLVTSERCSTAFYTARRAGWTTEQLAGDALFAGRRFKNPVAGIISRLTGLGATRPVDRPTTSNVIRFRSRFQAIEGAWCVCGEPPPHKVPPALTPDQTRERAFLLDRVVAEGMDPDTAEAQMRALVAAQHVPPADAW